MNKNLKTFILLLILFFGVIQLVIFRRDNNLPFPNTKKITIANQKGLLADGKLLLTCHQKTQKVRFVYKARFPMPTNQLNTDSVKARLAFSKHSPSYKSVEIFLTTIIFNRKLLFTLPLSSQKKDQLIQYLMLKEYRHVSFGAAETGTYFQVNHQHLRQHLPQFLETCS